MKIKDEEIPYKKSTSLTKIEYVSNANANSNDNNKEKNEQLKFYNYEENKKINFQKNKNYLNINYQSNNSYTNIYSNQINLQKFDNLKKKDNSINAFEIISADLYSSKIK